MPILDTDEEKRKRLIDQIRQQYNPDTLTSDTMTPQQPVQMYYGGSATPESTETRETFKNMIQNTAPFKSRVGIDTGDRSLSEYYDRFIAPDIWGTTRMSPSKLARVETALAQNKANWIASVMGHEATLAGQDLQAQAETQRAGASGLASTNAADVRAEGIANAQEAKNAYNQEVLNQREQGLSLKQLITENKWQPSGYGREYNPYTGKFRSAPVAPRETNQLSMNDVKSGYNMALSDIKNRIMIDATPEDQNMLVNQPPENISALLLSGKIGRTLTPDKKNQYIVEIKKATSFYQGLEQQVMGRKGVKLPERETQNIPEGATATNRKTGERMIYKGGKWQPL